MKKNKKGEANYLTIIIMALLIILLGMAFITSVANTKSLQTDKQSTVNETHSLTTCYQGSADKSVNVSKSSCNFTVTNAPTDWKLTSGECALGSVVITNGTASVVLVEGTDYDEFTQTGIIRMLNTSDTTALPANTTLTSYTYCADGYLQNSGDRGLANLWVTMMVLVILVSIAAIAYKIYNK